MFVLKTCRPEVSFKIPKCLNKCERSKERERESIERLDI